MRDMKKVLVYWNDGIEMAIAEDANGMFWNVYGIEHDVNGNEVATCEAGRFEKLGIAIEMMEKHRPLAVIDREALERAAMEYALDDLNNEGTDEDIKTATECATDEDLLGYLRSF